MLLVLGVLMLATLACNLLDITPQKSNGVNIRSTLPTLTPTIIPGQNPVAAVALVTEATPLPLPQQVDPAIIPVEEPESSEQPLPAPVEANPQPAASDSEQPSLTPIEANPQPASTGIEQPSPIPAEANLPPTSTGIASTPSPTVTPPTTPTPSSSGWSFAGVELYPGEFEEGVALYGDVTNETGSTQELNLITVIFYDGQGQVIGNADSVIDYWPIDIIPAGARLPFAILAPDIEDVANFELDVEAQPGEQTPHQSFQVLDLDQQQAEFGYCLTGQVQNMGSPLQEYLVVMAVLYDSQNRVVKFGEYYAPDPTIISGDQLEPFEICVETTSSQVARHEVRAWGE